MKNQKLLAVLFFLLTALVAKQFLFPEFDNYKTLQSQLPDAKAEYDNYQEIKKALLSKEIINNSTLAKLEKLNLILPKSFNEDFYIEVISFIVNNNGLILESIDVDQDQSSGDGSLKDVSIVLHLAGDYKDFAGFLKSLQNNITPLEVSEFSINSSGSQDLSNSWRYNVKILTRIAL